jgi:sec-independent protein translocase protein TatA
MPFVHGVGWIELVIILVIVMIVFGVGRLPEIGGAMGKAIREFRSSQSGESDSKERVELEAETKKE